MDKKVFIIILNYNGFNDTLECIKSLEKLTYKNYEIVIVDNNSTDNSFNQLKKVFGEKYKLISSGKNKGFAFGNNIGIKYALENEAEYILLINNDTIVEHDFLSILVKTAEEDEKIGISTGLILNYNNKNKVWYGGGEIDWNRFYGYHTDENRDINEIKIGNREVTFATGCLMLLKKEVIDKVGLLPEEYFMYYEDVDYCAKVKEAGYKIIYNPNSIIYHKISSSSGENESPFAVEWNTRNRLRFMNKYRSKVGVVRYIKAISFFYLTRIIKLATYLLKGRNDKVIALINGLRR